MTESSRTRPASSERSGFLPEVQALRAAAVTAVLLFHLSPTRITGGYIGVDVFFTISGFLITSHLLREVEQGRPRLGAFWMRRIRRLLPAAFLVLAASLAGSLLLAPDTAWRQFLREIGASTVYLQNWQLSAGAVDYFAEDNLPSPVQHYWSLSVEEQFYLAWPLLVAALALATTRQSARIRARVLLAGMSAVFVLSLAHSVRSGGDGYFSTFAHAWEFAGGGLIALGHRGITGLRTRVSPHVTALASWLGFLAIVFAFLAIVFAAMRFTGETPFPGTAALLPTAGAALVICAGNSTARWAPTRLVRLRPVQFTGGISYSLYLWHWPLIVLLPFWTSRPLNLADKAGILVAAVVLGALTKYGVEDRFRTHGPITRATTTRTLVALVVASAVVIAGCVVPVAALDRRDAAARETVTQAVVEDCFGAKSMLRQDHCTAEHTVVDEFGPGFAKSDTVGAWVADHYSGQQVEIEKCPAVADGVRQCVLGDPNASATMALVGDSHARALLPAILLIAEQRHWQVKFLWRSSCRPVLPLFESTVPKELEPACLAWKQAVVDVVAADPDIDLVVTTGATRRYAKEMAPAQLAVVADAFRQTWQRWTESGKQVLVVTDGPLAPVSVPDCIAKAGTEEDPCALPRDEVIPHDPIDTATRSPRPNGIHLVDITEAQCDDTVCHFVVGGLITHHDAGHFSATFVATLADWLGVKFDDLVP